MIRVRRAMLDDASLVLEMHTEASQWLASKGKDQWQPDAVGQKTRDRVRKSVEASIANKACWLAYLDDEIVGTITVDSYADPEFWTEEDNPLDAVYVHRMIVRRRYSGRGIGVVLLAVAEYLALSAGRRWVRLDAWSSNEDLHEYYRRLGFEHVRTLRYEHRGSGALFQRLVSNSAHIAKPFWTLDSLSS